MQHDLTGIYVVISLQHKITQPSRDLPCSMKHHGDFSPTLPALVNIHYTGLQNNFFSVTSTKVVELNRICYAECKYVLSFLYHARFLSGIQL
jgi:hypothetical protein